MVVGADRNLLLTADDPAMANKLAAILAELAMDAVEAGESDVWRSLRDLRLAVLNDSRERAPSCRAVASLCWPPPRRQPCWRAAIWRCRVPRSPGQQNNKLRDPAFITPAPGWKCSTR